MLTDLWTVAQNVLTLFLLIVVGIFCQKGKVLNETTVKECVNLVLYFANPCIIIQSCAREFDPTMLRGFLLALVAALVHHGILIAIAHGVFRDKAEERRRLLRYALVFSNAGFMAIPLQKAILGDEGVFYCAAYVIIFNIFNWTYGVAEISGDKTQFSPKKLITNPGIIGVTIGMVVFLCQIPLPDLVLNGIGHMATLNTPLPMLIVGYYLAQTDLRAAMKDLRSHLCIFLRLIGAPLLAMFLLLLCGVRGTVLTSLMICISTPVATTTTMFATRYDRDPLLSVNLVSVSTLFSVITMPVMVALTNYLGNLLG